MYAIEIRIAPEITSYSCAKLDISFKRSDLQKSEGVQMYIELFCRSERLKMMFRFDARIGSYFGRDPNPIGLGFRFNQCQYLLKNHAMPQWEKLGIPRITEFFAP